MLGALTALALLPTSRATAQEIADANCPGPSDIAIHGPQIAGTFTAQNTGNLTRAEIFVLKDAGSAGDYVLAVHTVDSAGVPTGTELASVTIPNVSVPAGTETMLQGVFPAPADVTAGTPYAIVASRGADVTVRTRTGNPCPGALYFRSSTSDPFAPVGACCTDHDLVFAVFVTPSSDTPSSGTPPSGMPSGTQLTCRGKQATISGTPGDDWLTGTAARDIIAASDGADRIKGLAGNDLICAGRGKDTAKGGTGKDKLLGQRGKDRLFGQGGSDVCAGGKKPDIARGCEVEKSI